MVTTVNCCLVTPDGIVFLDLPWKQLDIARKENAKLPEDKTILWEIRGPDGIVYHAIDILAKYIVSPKAGDGDGL